VSNGAANPKQILAIILGASSFDRAPKLAQGPAFYMSAQGFREYLTDPKGLSVPPENISWRFDDSRGQTDQLAEIADFLERRSADLMSRGIPPENLIVYYVGHGLFSGPDHAYCLAVRATDERNEGLTSIRIGDLASVVKTSARFLRKFLILDCCFSAAAQMEFQGGPLQAGHVKVLNEFPQRGTALLCSASAQDASLAPAGLPRTMFTDALLRSLRNGHPSLGSWLSLAEVGDLVKDSLHKTYPETWVRPEVHSPDQREGDVAGVYLFPNAAVREQSEKAKEAEAERHRLEQEKEKRAENEAKRVEEERLRVEREEEEKRRAEEAKRVEEERLRVEREEEEKRRAEEAKRALPQEEPDRLPIGNLCLGCMSDKGSRGICPNCGWKEGQSGVSPQHLTPGTVLDGKYLVGRALGQGGFGITYLAWDLSLNCKLAVKEYFPRDLCTRGKDEHTVQPLSERTKDSFAFGLGKFVEEGQALVRFRDRPGITSVLGYFRENRTAYLVMPYLEGQTFKDYLEEHGGKIPFQEAFSILSKVMDALREVHSKGMLHRDISPDNIYICETGQVKLLDFGAARYAIGEATEDLSVVVRRGYAPQEQFRRRGRQGSWTDVYALGATFYRAITGRVPSDAQDRLDHDDLIPPSRLGVAIPAKSETALLKALAVRAEKRYQSIAEFQNAITPPPPPRPPSPRPWWVRFSAAIAGIHRRVELGVEHVIPAAIRVAVVLVAVVAAIGVGRFVRQWVWHHREQQREQAQRALQVQAQQFEGLGELEKALETWGGLASQSGPLQQDASAAVTRLEGQIQGQAQQLEDRAQLGEALNVWRELANQSGPWREGALAAVKRVQGRMQEAQNAWNEAKQAEDSKQYDEAVVQYNKAVQIDAGLKAQAQVAIQNVEALRSGQTQRQVEAADYNRGLNLLNNHNYRGAVLAFKKVINRNLPDSNLVPQAQARVNTLLATEQSDYDHGLNLLNGRDYTGAKAALKRVTDRNLPDSTLVPKAQALLQDQGKFDQAIVAFNAGLYDPAKASFNDLVDRKTPWQGDAQRYLNQIRDIVAAREAVITKIQAGLYADALALLPGVSQLGGKVDDLKSRIHSAYATEFGQLQGQDQNEKDPQQLKSIAQRLDNLAQRAGSPLGSSARTEAQQLRDKLKLAGVPNPPHFWVQNIQGHVHIHFVSGWLSISGTTLQFEASAPDAKPEDNLSVSCSEIVEVKPCTSLLSSCAYYDPGAFRVRLQSRSYEFHAIGSQGELDPAQKDRILATIHSACPHHN
jgi:serine/threonine protein kinase